MVEIEILQEKENPLFKRKEIQINVKSDSSLKKSEAEEIIVQKFSTKKENVKIKNIKGQFGSRDFIVTANIYNSREDKNSIESDKKGEVSETETSSEMSIENTEVKPETKTETPAEEKPTDDEVEKEEVQNQETAKPEEELTQVNKIEE